MPLLSLTRKAAIIDRRLPVQNQFLADASLQFRLGQFSLVASAPGVGKSVFATNLAIRTKAPTLYFSADSDEFTVLTRACSILSGYSLVQVETTARAENWEEFFKERLHRADHVDWCYQSDIDMDFVWKRIQASAAMRGAYPELIVIDNMANTTTDPSDEYSELRGVCRDLQSIARTTRAHVLACHHVKGAKESGYYEIGMGDLLGNIGKIPEIVLGLNYGTMGYLNTHVAKNRSGRSGHSFSLPVDYTTATVGGFQI